MRKRPLHGVAGNFRDEVFASSDDPGLRPSEQLVARERHYIGALGQRLGDRAGSGLRP